MKLTRPFTPTQCPTCKGTGKAKQPPTYNSNGQLIPDHGATIPCPTCKGKRVIIK